MIKYDSDLFKYVITDLVLEQFPNAEDIKIRELTDYGRFREVCFKVGDETIVRSIKDNVYGVISI